MRSNSYEIYVKICNRGSFSYHPIISSNIRRCCQVKICFYESFKPKFSHSAKKQVGRNTRKMTLGHNYDTSRTKKKDFSAVQEQERDLKDTF